MLDIFSIIIIILHEICASTENLTAESTALIVKADIHESNSEHHDVGLLQDQSSEENNIKINKSQCNVIINVDNINEINVAESISLETFKKQGVPQFTNLDEDLDKKSEENKELKKNFFMKFKKSYFDVMPQGTMTAIIMVLVLGSLACSIMIYCYVEKTIWSTTCFLFFICLRAFVGGFMVIIKAIKQDKK